MKNNKIFSIFVVLLLIFSFLPLPVLAADTYVAEIYDYANLIDDRREASLLELGNKYKDSLKMDIVFVTTNNTNGKSTMEYSDDFYDGIEGPKEYNKNGILFIIDTDNGEVYISTCGRAIRLMSDSEIEYALDEFFYARGNNNDYGAGMYAMSENAFLNMTYWMSEGADSTFYYIRPSFPQILVSFIVTIILSITMLAKHNKANKTVSASHYIGNNGYKINNKKVNFIREYTNVRRGYYKQSSSSGRGGHRSGSSHRSSSGRRHGGGGRRL